MPNHQVPVRGFSRSCLGINHARVDTILESEHAVSCIENKIYLPGMNVRHLAVASSMAITIKITVRLRVYCAAVSASQDTDLDAVVSLISSLYLVTVRKRGKVGAAHASSSDRGESAA